MNAEKFPPKNPGTTAAGGGCGSTFLCIDAIVFGAVSTCGGNGAKSKKLSKGIPFDSEISIPQSAFKNKRELSISVVFVKNS